LSNSKTGDHLSYTSSEVVLVNLSCRVNYEATVLLSEIGQPGKYSDLLRFLLQRQL